MDATRNTVRPRSLLAVLALVALALPFAAAADDVDIITDGAQDPYVFFLLDISGSMNRSIPCSDEDVTLGNCKRACPTGFCSPQFISDDPDSRLRVAKEAIFAVMEKTRGYNFGFATFGQNRVRVNYKHWWYHVLGRADGLDYTGIVLNDGFTIFAPATTDSNGVPVRGEEHLFGQTYDCDDIGGNNDADFEPGRFVGCQPEYPADLSHEWMEEKWRRHFKLGLDNDTPHTYYLLAPDGAGGGSRYRVTFAPDNSVIQQPGDATMTAIINVVRCANADCTNNTPVATDLKLEFERFDEVIYWDDEAPANPADYLTNYNFFNRRETSIAGQSGWEPNNDTANDNYNGYNLKYTTVNDPLGRGVPFNVGDVIPWDWNNDRRELIMQRMAPNTIVFPNDPPDFGVATYFKDIRESQGGTDIHKLKTVFYDPSDPNSLEAKPLIARGGTPTGSAMRDFRDWVQTWLPIADNVSTGDKDLDCKNLNLIVVTDGQASGDEEGNRACTMATALFNLSAGGTEYHIRSWALALGDKDLATSGFVNVLNCIADNGASGADDHWPPDNPDNGGNDGDGDPDGPGPLFAKNKDEMVEQLEAALNVIGGTGKSFSAAAVQRSSSNADEKLILPSFVPWPDEAIWPGRVDAFVKPVPRKTITIDGVPQQIPDRQVTCADDEDDECLAWAAGEELVNLAPDAADLASDVLKIGTGTDERRVYYSLPRTPDVPETRKFLDIPTATADWENLTSALGICDPTDVAFATCAATAANQTKATDALKYLFGKKIFNDPDTQTDTEYVLGEIFHSTADIVGAPDNFRFFAEDRPGYRAFFTDHRFRRKMLAINSNDGQLHVFDAGIYRGNADDGEFDRGSGMELFAFAPRDPMPKIVAMAEDAVNPNKKPEHRYLVDGIPVHDDVFIDPDHNGTPTVANREWRTILMSGQREGGRSYFTLDMTEPDNTGTDDVPDVSSGTAILPTNQADFPALLWEFDDSEDCIAGMTVGNSSNRPAAADPNDPHCDEDDNGRADLGDTWSTPVITTIRVCTTSTCNTIEERFVAIVGGGMDAENKFLSDRSGNFLYMLDVETGKVLYKRKLGEGSAPSRPAAVDTDSDGVTDTIYIGTTDGFLYKADIRAPVPVDSSTGRITDATWAPFVIFDTADRPIFFEPAVIFVPSLTRFALAFGTGDREDLWEDQPPSNAEGRFYVLLDNNFTAATVTTPFTEADLTRVNLNDPDAAPGTSFLNPGWYFPLLPTERLITSAFSLSGITVFSTFEPEIQKIQNAVCAARGDSRVYVVFTTTGDAVADERVEVVESLLSETFVDSGAGGQGSDDEGDPDDPNDDQAGEVGSCTDSARSKRIVQELIQLFPRNCRFTNRTICLAATEDTTNLKILAPVPLCAVERNFKEL